MCATGRKVKSVNDASTNFVCVPYLCDVASSLNTTQLQEAWVLFHGVTNLHRALYVHASHMSLHHTGIQLICNAWLHGHGFRA